MLKKTLLKSCLLAATFTVTTSASALEVDTLLPALPGADVLGTATDTVSGPVNLVTGLASDTKAVADETLASVLALSGEQDTVNGGVTLVEGAAASTVGLIGAEDRVAGVLETVDATLAVTLATADSVLMVVEDTTTGILGSTLTLADGASGGLLGATGAGDLADGATTLVFDTKNSVAGLATGAVSETKSLAENTLAGVDVLGTVSGLTGDLPGTDVLGAVTGTVGGLTGGLPGTDVLGTVTGTVEGLTGELPGTEVLSGVTGTVEGLTGSLPTGDVLGTVTGTVSGLTGDLLSLNAGADASDDASTSASLPLVGGLI